MRLPWTGWPATWAHRRVSRYPRRKPPRLRPQFVGDIYAARVFALVGARLGLELVLFFLGIMK